MKKIITSIIIIMIFIIILFIVSKNSIINNTKNVLTTNINNIYNYINKYNYGKTGTINIVANYKGAHDSVNPINFSYSFINEYKDDTLYTTLENTLGYYTNELNNKYINTYMILKNKEQLKNIFTIKEINEEFNKIIFYFDESIINNVLNKEYKEFKLIINTKLLYLGINNYKLSLDDYELDITKDFKEFSNEDLKINITNLGYNLKYKDNLRISYKNDDKDIYNILINDCVLNLEMSDDIVIKVSKEVNIYKGLDIKVEFNNNSLNKLNTINRYDIPIFKYFDNLDLNVGGK